MIKKIYGSILITLSVVMFVVAFYIIIFGTIAKNNNRLLYLFGYSYASVPTNSMAGSFDDSFSAGTIVFIKNKSFEDLEHLDVVVFKSKEDKILIVHRLYIQEDGSYETKGDNNPQIDSDPFNEETYQGTVVSHLEAKGMSEALTGHQGTILMVMSFVLLGVVLFNVYQVLNIIFLKHREEAAHEMSPEFDKEAFLESVRQEFYESLDQKDTDSK